jgi:hypothetical protein
MASIRATKGVNARSASARQRSPASLSLGGSIARPRIGRDHRGSDVDQRLVGPREGLGIAVAGEHDCDDLGRVAADRAGLNVGGQDLGASLEFGQLEAGVGVGAEIGERAGDPGGVGEVHVVTTEADDQLAVEITGVTAQAIGAD